MPGAMLTMVGISGAGTSRLRTQGAQEQRHRYDLDAVVVLEWKKMLAVIGDNKVRMAFEGARQDGIVFRIVRHGEHLVPAGNNFGDPSKRVHGFHDLVRGVRPIPLHVRARQHGLPRKPTVSVATGEPRGRRAGLVPHLRRPDREQYTACC